MRFRREPTHRLVSATDAMHLTGLSVEALLEERDVQSLLSVNDDGTSDRMLRLPISLIVDDGVDVESGEAGNDGPQAVG